MVSKKMQAILWDFDGVIVNSLPIMEKCWQNVKDNLDVGNIPFSEYKKYIGRPFLEIVSILGMPDDLGKEAKRLYFSCDARNQAPELYADIKDVLSDLRQDYKTALITSKDMLTTQRWLKQLGLEKMFDDIQTPDSLPKEFGKPNPHYILQSLANLEVSPNDAIYFGDMDVDVEASKRAGVRFAHASWGYGNITELDGSVRLEYPSDIVRYLREVEEGLA